MKLYLVKQLNNSFKVADSSDYEKLKKIKVNQIYECEIKRKRNIAFHRKYFALINMVFQNQEHYKNKDHLRTDLQISAGFYEKRISFDGEEIVEAKSISFGSMKQDEFDELYNRVIDEIVKHFNFEKQLILDNIEQFY